MRLRPSYRFIDDSTTSGPEVGATIAAQGSDVGQDLAELGGIPSIVVEPVHIHLVIITSDS